MKRRTFMQSCAGGALALIGDLPDAANAEAGTLEDAFRNPPPSAHNDTWWHWMNGNISKVGITKDLEAMKRVGVRGFQIFQPGTGVPKGPVDFWSPEHIELMRHAAREANRLGLNFAMHNCPGWSSSGGPWLTDRPELSMQMLTWTAATVAGGRRVEVALQQPPARLVKGQPYYRDALVLAFPAAAGDAARPTRLVSGAGPEDPNVLTGGAAGGVELRPPEGGGTAFLVLEYAEPVEARSVTVTGASLAQPAGGRGGFGFRRDAARGGFSLEASDDGAAFRKIADIALNVSASRGSLLDMPSTASFPAVRARFFRLVTAHPRRVTDVRLSAAPLIVNWYAKSGLGGRGMLATQAPPPVEGPAIEPNTVLDITASMDPQGRLNWDAPAGAWTILRIGMTTTGAINAPAPDGGAGLECDKFNPAAIDFHFNQFFGKLFDAIAPLAKKGAAGATIDSYETGPQNWTAEFPQEFQKRRGYDPKPYLPAMTGRVVGGHQLSDRFLWDVRKTQGELMDEHYYGRFAELCHQHGMHAFIEPYEVGNFDEITAGRHADMPMGEFWLGQINHHSIKLAASVGHIYGKKVIAAESFTGQTRWQEYPYCMKTTGDLMYTQGLNEYVFHRYCHQPHPDVRPGMTMGPWGWFFERTNTWFEKSGTWLMYVARAQNMLRQGLFVADVLYFVGEDSPVVEPQKPQLNPPLPDGHDYDVVDAHAVMTRIKVRNGRIVLPDGMTYRALALRPDAGTSLETLRKVRDLVNEGMVLVGPRPEKNPGLTAYPESDQEYQRVTAEIWGDLNGSTVTERTLGKGRVFWGETMRAILDKLGTHPDFEYTARAADAPVNWIHRRTPEADIYFIASRRRQSDDLVCTFRVSGKQPEIWDPVTGETAKAAVFETAGGRTRVPVRLNQAGSVFVVFRSPAPAARLRSIAKDGRTVVSVTPFAKPAPGLHRDVADNFTVSLWVKPDLDGNIPVLGGATAGRPGGLTVNTASFVIYPPAGETVYGAGHAAMGLNAGRMGVAVYERSSGAPTPVLSARVPVAGWTHVAVVYRDGAPSLYLDGKLAAQAAKSGKTVHPGHGEAYQTDGAVYFIGHMSEPQLFKEALAEDRIRKLAAAGIPKPEEPPAFEPAGAEKPELLFWQDGKYTLRESAGKTSAVEIAGLGKPVEIAGPWKVAFPPESGAPPEITMQRLVSLNRHPQNGVKYFSGTATYTKTFNVPTGATDGGKRLFLDLGWVEMMADVKVNGKPIGNVWKPPYRLDITDAVKPGDNDLEIQVTNLWPNRLIGDEQLPPEYEYKVGGGGGGVNAGPIAAIPEWYAKGLPKPKGRRIAFSIWHHYAVKDEPLLEAGLVGPVRLRSAVRRPV